MRILAVLLFTLCSIKLFADSKAPAPAKIDPVSLLGEVARNYARAKTYHIEATQERIASNSRFYQWEKEDLTAIQGTKNRFRFEIKTGMTGGSWLQVSDGRTEWFYAQRWHRYIERPASPDGPSAMVHMVGFGGELRQAKLMVQQLEHLASAQNFNRMLPNQTIDLDGQSYVCYVVHFSRRETDRAHKVPYNYERTLWIEKQNKVIRKVVETSGAYIPGSPTYGHPIYNTRTTTIYPVVELNVNNPVSEFVFAPPVNAKKVSTLDPPYYSAQVPSMRPARLLNMPAPAVVFVARNGQRTPLAAYKGKPILLDFWATWCGPCMESMPRLARLNQRLTGNEITIISIDEDADAKAAEEFFARHKYGWQEFHDEHGAIQKAFEGNAIPLTVLIDRNGKIVFYGRGWEGPDLRTAIAKLGPQYTAFGSK